MNLKLHRLKTRFTQLAVSLCALMVLTSTPGHADEVFLDRVVAIVDQDIIMLSELNRRSQVFKEQLRARNTPIPPDDVFLPQVLDKMIMDRLQLARAQQNGIRITDQTLNDTLENIAQSNNLTLTEFKQQLEAEGQNYLEVREQIRNEMLVTRTHDRLVKRRIKVSEQEVNNYLASAAAKKQTEVQLHLAHIMIPVPDEPTSEQLKEARDLVDDTYQKLLAGADFAELSVAVSKSPRALDGGDIGWRRESELPEGLANALTEFSPGFITAPFRMGGGYQIVKVLEAKGGVNKMIDQTEVRHILIKENEIRNAEQAKALIEDIRQRIVDGASFADLAKQYSDDPGSGSNGGDLGWALPGQMVPEFDQMMNDTAIGDLSPPFTSKFGWHILQVTDRKQEDMGDRIMENQARQAIHKRKFDEELGNWLREIRAEAYIEIKL